jgi:HEAT repeat protein
LLQLQPEQSLPLIERLLNSPREGVREEAALAFGSSKHPGAFRTLERHYSARIEPGFRPTLLLAIASSRDSQAAEFLAKLVETECPAVAGDAIAALRIYRNDAALRARLASAVEKRKEESLARVFAREFGN